MIDDRMELLGMTAWFIIVAAAATLVPGEAAGCPVCGDADPQTAGTYIATTIFLSLLPLAMIGGGVWWLRRQLKRIADEELAMEPDAEVIALGPVRAEIGDAVGAGE